MKIMLAVQPAFSEQGASWHAMMPIGGRGTLTFTWFTAEERHERKLTRWTHGLEVADFLFAKERLCVLPEHCGPIVDDCGGLSVALDEDGKVLQRTRHAWHLDSDDDTQVFDLVWARLVRNVHRALRENGVPPNIVAAVDLAASTQGGSSDSDVDDNAGRASS